jgi:hypothetical protein
MAASNPSVLRRSSRIPMNVPILVTSVSAPHAFSEMCETLVVNAHGCALRSATKLDAGVPVHFQTNDGKWTMAHIVDCQPLNHGRTSWMLGASLEQPTNFWGLEKYPEDWAQLVEVPSPTKIHAIPKPAPVNDLHAVIAELVEPLHAAVSEIRQRLERRENNRSQFEISLSYIPPEVEEKIAIRLRDELGTQVMDKTRIQAETVLEATKTAISQRIIDARNQFRGELVKELHGVEERAQNLSDEITTAVQQHFHSGEERLEQQLLEAGIRLERRGEEFFRVLQNRLGGEHAAYRQEMQQVRAAVASEVADVQAETTNMANRMATLEASAHRLESEMENHLTRVAGDVISGARVQLENALDVVLKDLGTRNAKELESHLDDAQNRLKIIQKGIETSVSDLVKTKVAESLVLFGQTIEALAQDAVSRWREGLANDLSSMTDILERKPQVKAASTQ